MFDTELMLPAVNIRDANVSYRVWFAMIIIIDRRCTQCFVHDAKYQFDIMYTVGDKRRL